MPRKRSYMPQMKLDENGIPLHPTSSLNNYIMCECGAKFKSKQSLILHIRVCDNGTSLVCRWCNTKFANRGSLMNHAFYMHGQQKSLGGKQKKVKCDVCDAKFVDKSQLKFHIRSQHFNLYATIPHANDKQVNQVWFEKVHNTNLVMQIKKTGANSLVMKALPPNSEVKIHASNEKVDLRDIYPTGRKKKDEICRICLKIYRKHHLKKHMNEQHFNITKHTCNNCNVSFKRSYQYIKHVCNKRKRKLKGVTHVKDSLMRIQRVETVPVEIS